MTQGLLSKTANNNNFLDRLTAVESALAELQTLFSDKLFRLIPGDEGFLGKRAYSDIWLSLGWPPANVEKLHVYDGNLKVEGQGFEGVTGGTIYLQNKPALLGNSPADNDVAGLIRALAVNDAGNPIIIADMYFQCTDVTEGSEDGAVRIVTQKDYVDAFVFNLVRDRCGINSLDPQAPLHAVGTGEVAGRIERKQTGDNNTVRSVLQILRSYNGTGGAAGIGAGLDFVVESAAGGIVTVAQISAQTSDLTASSEDAVLRLATIVAGTLAVRGYVGQGFVMGSPAGGDKGAGSGNFQAVYDDNTLLTPYVLEAALTGDVDLVALDAKVPNRVIPPKVRIIPAVTRTIPARKMKVARGIDEKGRVTGVEEVIIPAREEVLEPEREEEIAPESIEERIHGPARRFVANLEELDPALYAAKWRRLGHLPAFPSEAEWAARGNFSTGDLLQRVMETVEVQAVHIAKLEARLAALEGGGG